MKTHQISLRGTWDVKSLIYALVFVKWPFLKNRPGPFSVLARALIIVLEIGSIYSFIAHRSLEEVLKFWIQKESFFQAVGAVLAIYWSLITDMNKKWEYVSETFHQIAISLNVKEDKEKIDFMHAGLALDLLTSDLWAHRSFAQFFKKNLENAINNHSQNETERDDLIRKMKHGKLTENDVQKLLDHYHLLLAPEPATVVPISNRRKNRANR